jgi:hypothetical protein
MISGSPVAAATSSARSSELAGVETALASLAGAALAGSSTEPACAWSPGSAGLDTPQAAANANMHTHIDRFILLSLLSNAMTAVAQWPLALRASDVPASRAGSRPTTPQHGWGHRAWAAETPVRADVTRQVS